jgi:hypothetical protein
VIDELSEFLQQLNAMTMGTRTADNQPHVHMGLGCRVEDAERLRVFVADFAMHQLEESLRDDGQVAVTIGNPMSHESYQFKGVAERVAPCDDADKAASESYLRDLIEMTIQGYGMPESLRDAVRPAAVAVTVKVREVFNQTPGPNAGQRILPKEAP